MEFVLEFIPEFIPGIIHIYKEYFTILDFLDFIYTTELYTDFYINF